MNGDSHLRIFHDMQPGIHNSVSLARNLDREELRCKGSTTSRKKYEASAIALVMAEKFTYFRWEY